MAKENDTPNFCNGVPRLFLMPKLTPWETNPGACASPVVLVICTAVKGPPLSVENSDPRPQVAPALVPLFVADSSLSSSPPPSSSTATVVGLNIGPLPGAHSACFLCSANSWSLRRAFSCFFSSFRDLEETFRANSLCLRSFNLCLCA